MSKLKNRVNVVLLTWALFCQIFGYGGADSIGVAMDRTFVMQEVDTQRVFSPVDQDQIIVLHIFASWCHYCRREHAMWKSLQKIDGVGYYAVVHREQGVYGKQFIESRGENPFDGILVLDGENARKIQVHMVPDTIVLYKNRILDRKKGSLSQKRFTQMTGDNLNSWVTVIQSLAGGGQ